MSRFEQIADNIAPGAYCNFINTWADLSRISMDSIGRQG
jgi:hypothetical protein